MESSLLTPPESGAAGRDGDAPQVPAKFRDAETGAVRVDALLKSYLELERKLARMVELPGDDAGAEAQGRFRRALGVPERPEDYAIEAPHALIQPDPEVNAVLHGAGFTPQQAQLVYDLAAERMLPAIGELAREFEADRQVERLTRHFGGEEKWREVAAQLATWGKKQLPREVFDALSTTFEGVVAMHRMMTSGEPGLLGAGDDPGPADEAELRRLMADPKYWRERDPGTVQKVGEGFRRLFPGTVAT